MILLPGGMTYLTQNIPGNMMQKTIIIVQGATGGGPITLTVRSVFIMRVFSKLIYYFFT